jgi:hypothetical protein
MSDHPHSALVVSPQFPCGAAWLANAAIELGVAPTHLWGFDPAGEWAADADGTLRYVANHRPWRQTLPSLEPGRRYGMDQRWDLRFTHLFPWQQPRPRRVVLVVRDPRDALYSEWQRQLRNGELPAGTDFATFTRSPFHGGPVSHIDLLWLHLHCWLHERAADPETFYLLRFEDWKHDDRAALSAVATWLGLDAAPAAIARACEASDVRRLLAVEERIERDDPKARRFNRRGLPQEWLLRWDPDMHRQLGPHWHAVLDALRYPRSPVTGDARPGFETRQVLAWRDPITAGDLLRWATAVDDAKGLRP